MANLGAVGAFSRQGDSALNTLTVVPTSPVGITGGLTRGIIGHLLGDTANVRLGGPMSVGQAVQSTGTR